MREKILASLKAREDIEILEQHEEGILFGVHFTMPDKKNPGRILHGYAAIEGEKVLGKDYSHEGISLAAYLGGLHRPSTA